MLSLSKCKLSFSIASQIKQRVYDTWHRHGSWHQFNVEKEEKGLFTDKSACRAHSCCSWLLFDNMRREKGFFILLELLTSRREVRERFIGQLGSQLFTANTEIENHNTRGCQQKTLTGLRLR